ncbi:MAG: ATP-binding protein [Candidatus Bathyarchaeota archaeon]
MRRPHKTSPGASAQLEEKLNAVIEGGDLAWWEMEYPSGKVTYSDKKVTMLGYTPEEFKAEHYRDFVDQLHPEDQETAMEAMRRHLSGDAPRYEVDYRIRAKGGDWRWFHDTGTVTQRGPDNEPLKVTGVVIDITARKSYENKLEALHAYVNNLGEASTVQEIAEVTLEAIARVIGLTTSVFMTVGKVCLSPIYSMGVDLNLVSELPLGGRGITVRAARTGETQLVHDTRLDPDYLQDMDAEVRLSELDVPIKVAGKAVAVINLEDRRPNAYTEEDRRLIEIYSQHVAGALQRITHQGREKRINARLHALNRNAGSLSKAKTLNQVYDLVISILRDDFGYRWAGIALVEGDIARYVRHMAVKLGPDDYLSLDGKGVTVRVVKTGETQLVSDARLDLDYVKLIQVGEPFLSELAVPVWVEGQVHAVVNLEEHTVDAFADEDRDMVELLALHMGTAITLINERRRHAEQQTAQVRELLEGVQRISSMVRHDLKGPLSTIKNAAYLIKDSPKDVDEYLTMINRSVDYALNILEDLRNIAATPVIQRTLDNLVDLLDQSLSAAGVPPDITVVKRYESPFIAVSVDATSLRRVFDNLIKNAVEATPGEGTLTLTVSQLDHEVEVTVADTGTGMPPEVLKEIFRPFYTTKPTGTGLGLSICKRVVELHGGTITVESRVGAGSVFTVRLPVSTEVK